MPDEISTLRNVIPSDLNREESITIGEYSIVIELKSEDKTLTSR
jgi:hypothetical protein